MTYQIKWLGNQYTNSSSREGYVPFVICNHISAGTLKSMTNWFTSPDNKVSSAHFGVGVNGEIVQYVEIERMAWTQGIPKSSIPKATAKVVHDMNVNPNLYCVGIECEGTDGNLTEAQFNALVWLHKYIRDYVLAKWNKHIEFDSYHVIGHFQVDPVRKPNCPGPKFPWTRLYEELQDKITEEDEEEMKLTQEQWSMLGKALDGLYHKSVNGEFKVPLITSYEWADKAFKGELTASELNFLNIVINARQAGIDC